jgi:hypothetical protein
MAEKVRDGVDGFHFASGNPIALASLVRQIADNRAMLTDLGASLSGMPELVSGMDDYLALYRDLVAQNAQMPSAVPELSLKKLENEAR